MLDRYAIAVIRWPLKQAAVQLSRWGAKPDTVTLSGFFIGLLALPALALQAYGLALSFIVINRLFDGLDGAIAREQGLSDAGGFLDITLDFIFYASIPFGFALADPTNNAIAASFLLFCFMGTGASFLAFATMASKHQIDNPVYANKSLYYIGGITEGTETIASFVLMCLFPSYMAWIAWVFGIACLVTASSRVWAGYHTLRDIEGR